MPVLSSPVPSAALRTTTVMPTRFGAVAAGHKLTAQAAEDILREGGNAFDASIAAVATACVVEPALASLGGGGFSTVFSPGYRPKVFDYFSQTPKSKSPESEIDFREIIVDFGAAKQSFHVGRGSVAVPGVIAGLFSLHGELASMPMRELLSPAIQYAKEGVRVSKFQGYTIELLTSIFCSTPACNELYRSPEDSDRLVGVGEVLRQTALADSLEAMAYEGSALFYKGEMAQRIDSDMRSGGHLCLHDLEQYEVIQRDTCESRYRQWQLHTNPTPSTGGTLISFALQLLLFDERTGLSFGSPEHIERLMSIMKLTSQAQLEAPSGDSFDALSGMLDETFVESWREKVAQHPRSYRGTTHVSIIDRRGNAASSTISNGEGSAYVVPGTGIVLNNMLGEDDLSPQGLQCWPNDVRLTSMMAPSLLTKNGKDMVAIGSGGSSRIRTAMLQVISNLIDHRMDCEQAVEAPRIHFDDSVLSLEGGFDVERLAPLLKSNIDHQLFHSKNLFFGGVHVVMSDGDRFQGAGDPRRDGVFVCV